jgi:Tfp pilus assembly protein PilN
MLGTMRKVELNLAKKPFNNRRLFWVGILISMLVSSVFMIWISGERIRVLGEISLLQQQKKEKEIRIQELRKRIDEVRAEVPQTVLNDEQKLQLASARLLISRGMFSWNRLMSDIERYVPQKAFVTNIKIDEAGKIRETSGEIVARAIIEIKLRGQSAAQMTEMMTQLEHSSGLFAVDQASQDPMADDGNVPFTLRIIYRPVHTGEEGRD